MAVDVRLRLRLDFTPFADRFLREEIVPLQDKRFEKERDENLKRLMSQRKEVGREQYILPKYVPKRDRKNSIVGSIGLLEPNTNPIATGTIALRKLKCSQL